MVALLVVVKVGIKLKALLVLLPKLKLMTTFGSMLISIAAYALIWGWAFAAGFVLLLLIHELGHVIQLRREGVEASAPMFIPFVGAVISAKSLGDDAAAEARVGLAGPILGSAAALLPLGLWLLTGGEFWRALAYVGFFINLFNLLPILPLDGGRAMAAVSPWVWVAGMGALIPLVIFFPDPILVLILVFGGIESWRRWRARKTPEGRAYNDIQARIRVLVALTYLTLAALLVAGMSETFFERHLNAAAASSPKVGVGPGGARPAPPPALIPPRFTVERLEPLSGGRVRLTATLPRRGTLIAGDKADPAMGTAFPGTPRLVLSSIPVASRGRATLVLGPTDPTRASLERGRSVKAKLTIAFTPRGESLAQRRTADVTLVGG